MNDESIELLAKEALTHARAGADMVAPSDMFDGRVRAIRAMLDENNFHTMPIMSYAAKYASGFYGPFREAARKRASSATGGRIRWILRMPTRRSGKCRPTSTKGRTHRAMVKPAMPYLDIIRRVKDTFRMPTAAYNVSGEYSMVKAAGQRGWIDEPRVMLEMLTGIKRAGADLILTYFAKDAARLL